MLGYGDGRPDGLWGILMGIGWSITAFILFLIWLGVIVLLVRFLVIATRAAKHYLSQNGQEPGLFPKRPVAPTAPAAAAPTTTAPRTTTAPTKPVTKPVTKPPKPRA